MNVVTTQKYSADAGAFRHYAVGGGTDTRIHAVASVYGKFKIRWWRQGRGGGARGLLELHVLRLDLRAGRQRK